MHREIRMSRCEKRGLEWLLRESTLLEFIFREGKREACASESLRIPLEIDP